MEKKTIGSFIAVLRKAAGMTQRELAERLCVSDKSVSRWERDECAPDLSLIPVIAEIFGVTSDELLRGERRAPPANGGETAEESRFLREKGLKQAQNLMKKELLRLKERNLIALGTVLAGVIAALICNYVFLRGLFGFFLALAFYSAALIMEICFLRRAALEKEDAYDIAMWQDYRNQVTEIGKNTFFVLWLALGIDLPYLFLGVGHIGISYPSYSALLLVIAPLFAAVAFLFYRLWGKSALLKREMLFLSEKELEKTEKRRILLKKATINGIAFCLAFLLAAAVALESTMLFVKRMCFDDYISFKNFMQQSLVYDEDGNPSYVNDETGRECQVLRDDGTTIFSFRWSNEEVRGYTVNEESEDRLPILVLTDEAYSNACAISDAISSGCLAMSLLSLLVAALVYVLKARRI